MFELGHNAGFIIASYGAVALVMIAVIGWTLVDYRAQKRDLATLEARGVRRRSAMNNDPEGGQ